jgi:4-hydroxy-tetrahydrodipicolinate synthase
LTAHLGGAIVPLVTPFAKSGEVEGKAVSSLVDFFVREGADALMPTALTGEGPLLGEDETVLVWEEVVAAVAGRKPVYPAILSFTTARAVRLARRAEALGARAVMAAPIVPELYARRSERDVLGFFEAIAGACSLPLILFNYPSFTGIDLTPGLVERLLAIDSVRFIKESTGDSRRVSALLRRFSGRLQVVCGAPGAALECLALGCTSWITGILNIVPRAGKDLLTAVHERGELDNARRIYFERILPVTDLLERTSNPTGTIKAGLRAQGVEVGTPRPPGQDLLADELRELERILGSRN